MVTEFIDAVSLLPDCKPMEDLKEWAEAAEEYLEDLIEEKCPVLNTIIDDDIKGYAEMMKRELITPEKAGFCLCKSMSEEKEPIEHDTEDEKSIYDLTALLMEAKDVQGRIGSFAAELEDILDMIAQFDALEKSCHEDA